MKSTRSLRSAAIVVALLSLAGCKTLAPQTAPGDNQPPKPSHTLSATDQFLNQATPGSIATLAASPWGNNVELTAHPRYFAASGQTCMRLTVRSAANADTPALACRQRDGQWSRARLLAQQ